MKRSFLLPVFILVMTVYGISQNYSLNQQYQPGDRPAQYILGSQDVLLITVNLWGHVQRPDGILRTRRAGPHGRILSRRLGNRLGERRWAVTGLETGGSAAR